MIIGSIGLGLFILIIAWLLTLIIFVIGIKFESNSVWFILGFTSLLTIVLLLIPIKDKQATIQDLDETIEYDYIIIYKTLFLCFITITSLVSFIVFFINHCLEPIYIKQQ